MAIASSQRPGRVEVHVHVDARPAVAIMPSAERTSVFAPITMFGSTPSMICGLPALPMPTMRPSLIPMSHFTMPSTASMHEHVA